jgi:hypothetical protein
LSSFGNRVFESVLAVSINKGFGIIGWRDIIGFGKAAESGADSTVDPLGAILGWGDILAGFGFGKGAVSGAVDPLGARRPKFKSTRARVLVSASSC